MVTEDIKEKYETVGNMLDDALKKIQSIQLNGEEENAELSHIFMQTNLRAQLKGKP